MSLFFPCHTHVPFDFPSQIVKPPQVLSHLLCSGRYSAFSQFTSFSCCVSRCASPLCLPGEAFATADRPARSEQWSFGGEQFQAPPRWDTTGAIDFPSQIVKSPQILSHLLLVVAIFFPGRAHVPLDFPSQVVKPPQVLSHLLCSGRYSSFSHFTSFSCCVSCCASALCLPGEAFATADRPAAHSEQWSCGGEQFQAPPRWDTTGAIDFPSQIVKSPQILSHLLLVVAIFFPGRAHVPLDFPGKISTSPISSAFSGRYFSLAAPTCH